MPVARFETVASETSSSGTTYIQRVNTVGGRAPAASQCDVDGETTEIDYSADYYFWKGTGS